ncbi:DUF4255 domain-containing protein [Oxynema sp. CENA135]|uniref:DUF4255 domain-containing protein n=1 Tax=Oxynema sp. CENA135 TaxID=984206 RepID=UPI00190A3264|nr:DUF4255 domain-containing protein [Oxynema sp. CENA135]MBK4728877.1 DUF4255 domain-containing protein [Oxynema sp. CENA135]
MSNYLAIATVTATLQRTLQAAVQLDVDGARVTTVRPSSLGNGTPEHGVNVFLYQVVTNPALNNMDSTRLRMKGTQAQRQSALDLYYMMSFYGNDAELEPQRLLGSVIRTFSDFPILDSNLIRETLADSTFGFLSESNLEYQIQQINVMPLDLNLEDLSKVWSVFFQTPYVLSMAYKVLVVTIEGDKPNQRSLPVRGRNFGRLGPFLTQPTLERVMPEGGPFQPILLDSTLIIRGKHLAHEGARVRFADLEVIPSEVSDLEIKVPLSDLPRDRIRAGVHTLQVLHPIAQSAQPPRNGNGATPGRRSGNNGRAIAELSRERDTLPMVQSNALPFVLRPRVVEVEVEEIEGRGNEPRNARVGVTVNVTVAPAQQVVLSMNEWSVENPKSYQFESLVHREDTSRLLFSLYDVKPGEYLIRIYIDGAESQLAIDDDPESPTFNWYVGPKVAIA